LDAKCKLLYSEIAVSQKRFVIGHMYVYIFLLRMTDTMTYQNTDLSSLDILYTANVYFCKANALAYPLCAQDQNLFFPYS
jgi:hypothetical protein